MVKKAALVISLATYLIADVISMNGEAADSIEKTLESCRAKFPISDETLNFLHSMGSLRDESDEAAMCYVNCVMEGMEIVEAGVFRKEEQMKIAEELLKGVKKADGSNYDVNAMKKNIEDCSKLKGKSTCHTTYIITQCIEKKRKEMGIVEPN
ncbi:uncharacterized protein [Hetaerina americana]|uniref:uncharacterized protein n=1 Tax=Hetaerina americana TaxID=62018 RepID=UPI003A7F4CB5